MQSEVRWSVSTVRFTVVYLPSSQFKALIELDGCDSGLSALWIKFKSIAKFQELASCQVGPTSLEGDSSFVCNNTRSTARIEWFSRYDCGDE